MATATEFLECARVCFTHENYPLCIFMLHQVVEQCCIGMIRVYLAYRADIHNLYRLLRLCDIFSTAPSGLLPEENEEGRKLFDMMVKSYSEARYKDDFEAGQLDAEKLFSQVEAFQKMAEALCEHKIEELVLEAELYKQSKICA